MALIQTTLATLGTPFIFLASASFANAVTVSPAVQAPDSATQLLVTLDRNTPNAVTTWPNTTDGVNLNLQESLDGGVTFSTIAAFSAIGGQDTTSLKGVVAPTTVMGVVLDPGISRQYRVQLFVLNQAVLTACNGTFS